MNDISSVNMQNILIEFVFALLLTEISSDQATTNLALGLLYLQNKSHFSLKKLKPLG